MTNIRLHKDLLLLIMIIVLALVAVIYGFSVIPNPIEQRDIAYDKTRSDDLESISYAITNFNSDQSKLPDNLQQITLSSYDDTKSKRSQLEDPQTKAPYLYRVLSPTSYELCATFAAESENFKPNSADASDFAMHAKGHYCFKEDVYDYSADSQDSRGGGGSSSGKSSDRNDNETVSCTSNPRSGCTYTYQEALTAIKTCKVDTVYRNDDNTITLFLPVDKISYVYVDAPFDFTVLKQEATNANKACGRKVDVIDYGTQEALVPSPSMMCLGNGCTVSPIPPTPTPAPRY